MDTGIAEKTVSCKCHTNRQLAPLPPIPSVPPNEQNLPRSDQPESAISLPAVFKSNTKWGIPQTKVVLLQIVLTWRDIKSKGRDLVEIENWEWSEIEIKPRLSSWTSSPITSSTLSRTGFLEVDGGINELNMICNLVSENVSYQSLLSFRTLPTFIKSESHWLMFSTTLYRVDGKKSK